VSEHHVASIFLAGYLAKKKLERKNEIILILSHYLYDKPLPVLVLLS
jgi:predicted permease